MRRYLIQVLLVIVFLAGFGLRTQKLNSFPPGIYGDEAAIGYNAYSILKTGKDEYGTRLPLQFRSFDDYKAPLAIYLTVPFVKIFGTTPLAVRLPSALLGSMTILTTFWLGRCLFKSDWAGLAAAFLLAFSPWHVHVSRAMFEANVSLALFFLGVTLYLAKPSLRGMILAALFLGLSLYAYHPAKLLAPLMALVLAGLYPKPGRGRLVFLFIFGVISLPFLGNFLFGQGEAKFQQTVIFRRDYVYGEIGRRVDEQRNLSELPAKLKPVFYNKPTELTKEFLRNYFKSFGTEYWYLFGEANQTLTPGPMGMFYFWEFPLLILGLFYLFTYQPRVGKIVGLWLVLAPLPAALTGTTYVLRHLLLLPWPQLVAGYGFVKGFSLLAGRYKLLFWSLVPVFALVISFSIANFIGHYFFTYGKKNASWWGYGEKEIVRLTQLNQEDFNLFFFQDTASLPITYAFLATVEPETYQSTWYEEFLFGDETNHIRIRARKFGKVMIGSLLAELKDRSPLPEGTVLFLLPEQVSQLEPDFTINDPGDGRVLFAGFIIGEDYRPRWGLN